MLSKRFAKIVLCTALVMLIGGSDSSCNEYKVKSTDLPEGVKNVVQRGNGWITFDLNIEGTRYRFLYFRNHNEASHAITQVIGGKAEIEIDETK